MFGKKKREERIKLSKESKQTAKKIFRFIKPYKGFAGIGMMFLVLSSSMSAMFPPLMGQLLGNRNFSGGLEMDKLTSFDFSEINLSTLSILLLLIFFFQAAFSFGRIYFFSVVTENILRDIRRKSFEKLVASPMQFFNKNKVGELTSRIATDINLLQETFNSTLAELTRQIIIVTAMTIIICFISLPLAFRMLAVVPPVVIIAVFFGKYIKNLSKAAQDSAAESNSVLEESLMGIVNVKSFTNELFEINRFSKAINSIRTLSLKSAVGRGSFVSFIILCMMGSIVFVIWSGISMIEAGEITDGDFYSFIMCTVFLAASIGTIPDLYAKFQKAIGSSEHLMTILENETEDVLTSAENTRFDGKVEFKNVSFHYPSRKEVQVLKDISFTVEAGQTVALVGSSGSGKSTIASLLLQLYDLNDGVISIDGQSSENYHLKTIRKNMAYVPQEVILFGGSIRENIAYGKLNASEEEIREAAKSANALDFIDGFPDGLDTIVGDRGIQLSGGQRQRIAIARAILKNPSILILDEATSALDTESEQLVKVALDKLMEGRTSLVIAHRLSTIKNADKIIVLENGEIIESGTHSELSANREGSYFQLNQNQI